MSFDFGSEARLPHRKDFKRVHSLGRKIVGRHLIIWFDRNGQKQSKPRLGLSVSRKVGGAVFRNRLKRLAREAFRLNRHVLLHGLDMLVYLRPGCRWKNFKEAEKNFLELCQKHDLINEKFNSVCP